MAAPYPAAHRDTNPWHACCCLFHGFLKEARVAERNDRERKSSRATDAVSRDPDDGLQTGGTRGSSNFGGPESSAHTPGEDPEKNSAVNVNRGDHDSGSRASLREPLDPTVIDTEGAPQPGRLTDAPRGPLPPGANRADYVGGEEPHKTDVGETTPGASGRRNEVL